MDASTKVSVSPLSLIEISSTPYLETTEVVEVVERDLALTLAKQLV